jgi:hypothetical protein
MTIDFLKNYFSAYQKVNVDGEKIKARVQCASYCTIVIPLLFGIVYGVACALSLIGKRFSKGSSSATAGKVKISSTTILPTTTPVSPFVQEGLSQQEKQDQRNNLKHSLEQYKNACLIIKFPSEFSSDLYSDVPKAMLAYYQQQSQTVYYFIQKGNFKLAETLITALENDMKITALENDSSLSIEFNKIIAALRTELRKNNQAQVNYGQEVNVNDNAEELYLKTLIELIDFEILHDSEHHLPAQQTVQMVIAYDINKKEKTLLQLKFQACLTCLARLACLKTLNAQDEIEQLKESAQQIIETLPQAEKSNFKKKLSDAISNKKN